ncbi:hypothetical protein MT340_001750 [Staphylococcus sp. NRL 16/872]|uniref:hypothetical protein n=1 Tax=Staphylococcus sp. NRL 16/872 TaxID=2930131 RepID=UPI001FB56407|nr:MULTISPECIES: hypothetical protein [unclassified Staphylococcus]MCJ1655492.1 hypothetical protein [Staphylococcus sp. NRL 21/187]MCJ1661325.1 hypothetical protein [Staphylococcus sp. NRL 18/288]MCJ1667214.1 hypothetical protein [Staphylococcus sp. NRL 19/737]WEN69697.1 hypothetical protein MT340_001750 [Staphylococcus sp. NRL 16/872]
MLRYAYHLLSALFISIILLMTMTVMDVLAQSTHLTLLLINIDFLVDPSKTPLILELLIHVFIGFIIYIIFFAIYHISKPFYKISYFLLFIVFAALYPLLIVMAQRSFFHFSWGEYGLWMMAHLIFIMLMAFAISYFSKKRF